ncbi:MAG TPA: patatin-like phospholipase family protein [Candidatus Acidoferrales bacterium]|jgi:NTE family protein|nr:patatin-like phospholipase family protein [Candidatus Acidoferrales bacterium]
MEWLKKAVSGIRSFAYAGNGDRESAPAEVKRAKVGVALGGGFARGIAHIGVLRVLEESRIPIDFIAGTSVGALVAATYASGTPLTEMEKQGVETSFRDFGRWTVSRMGMASNERLEDYLHKFTPARYFHELKVPLSIVATDIISGESVHFTEGEIGPALRASCAYPGLFLPVEYRNHILVDGFLTETVPAPALRKMGADVIISIHLEPGLLDARPRNTIEVISRSFSIIQMAATQSWRSMTDILIEPDVHHILWDEFVKTPQLVAAGEAATRAALPKIRAALDGHFDRRVTERRKSALGGPQPPSLLVEHKHRGSL